MDLTMDLAENPFEVLFEVSSDKNKEFAEKYATFKNKKAKISTTECHICDKSTDNKVYLAFIVERFHMVFNIYIEEYLGLCHEKCAGPTILKDGMVVTAFPVKRSEISAMVYEQRSKDDKYIHAKLPSEITTQIIKYTIPPEEDTSIKTW